MMWWACPSRTMWRSVPKSFRRWAMGWPVMWARARWWAFFPPSGACVRLSPGMCLCRCFGGGSPRARDSTPCRGMACSLDLLGRMYMPGSLGGNPSPEMTYLPTYHIDQGEEVDSQFHFCEDNDKKGGKVLQDQWSRLKQQIGQTELTIFNLLQKPEEHLL